MAYRTSVSKVRPPRKSQMKANRRVSGLELVTLAVEAIGHRRTVTMIGASVVATVMGATEWPAMGQALQRAGYSQAAVYKIRVDMRRVGVLLAEAEDSEAPAWGELVSRLAHLDDPQLTGAFLVQ
jgi:hypothetical protein